MRKIFLAAAMLCLALMGASPLASAQSAAGLSGVWVGYYGYDADPNKVEFQMKLRPAGSGFSGASVEDNTFGDPSVLFLTANISGSLGAGRAVIFTKTYDGTGGQSHSVQYNGVLSASGKCISGKWRIGQGSGPFEMCTDVRLVS
jgi:hypothetical protein